MDVESIDHVSRMPTNIKNIPENIVVRFSSRIKRDNFLAAYKAKRVDVGEIKAGLEVKELSC